MSEPVVRNEYGAILGIDFRQTPLTPEGLRVPGQVPARAVFPGDVIRAGTLDADLVVHRVTKDEGVRVVARTREGLPVDLVFSLDLLVDVVAVGAFER